MNFEESIQLGLAQELAGWDFAWLNARTAEEPLPWDYRALVLERMHPADQPRPRAMLDMDTGGGEFLSTLAPFPPVTWATEGYPPNVPLAQARLEPLGIQVADLSADPDRLPFDDLSFDLVINRHGGMDAAEIQRVLRPGGRFISQQVGGQNCIDLNRALQNDIEYAYADSSLESDLNQFQASGLRVLQAREAFPRWTFKDIAGVVFYLKAIPWQIADFSVEKYHQPLLKIHQEIERTGGYTVREHRLLLELMKD